MKNAIKILYTELIFYILVIFIVIVKGPGVIFDALKYGLFFIRIFFGV